jgi:Tfp pilus assembly protein PilE
MNKYYVKAFTLMEVAITMLITALLIGLAYTSYGIIVKSYRSFVTKNDGIQELVSLDHVLARDFDRAELVIKDNDGIILKNTQHSIKYSFSPTFIIREALRTDTFNVQIQDLQTSFEHVPIIEVQETEEQNRIDELSFTLLFQNEKIPYHYGKRYSAANLIQRNPNAIH